MNFLAFATIQLSTLTLFTLKLAGVIKWAWVWVFSPIWGAAALFILAMLFLIALHHHFSE